MLRDHVTGVEDFRFPVARRENILHDDTAAAGAVYAKDAFGTAFHNHSDVLDMAATAKNDEVAGQYFAQRNAFALAGLSRRTGRGFYTEFIEHETGETRAIKTGFRAYAGVTVLEADKILGVAGDEFAELHHFGTFCARFAQGVGVEGRTNKEEKKG